MSDTVIGLLIAGLVAVMAIFALARRPIAASSSLEAKLAHIDKEIARTNEEMTRTKHDTTNLRHVMNNVVTNQSFGELKIQVAEVRGQVSGMEMTLERNTHQLNRIEDYLMRTAADAIVGRHTDGDQG